MGRPKNADGQRTRQAILDAALHLFAEKGFFGTSLRDVAAAVGVRESALYNYFRSKDALFEALIAADVEEKAERLAPLADGPIGDARAVLERYTVSALARFAEPRQQQLFRILLSDGIRLTKLGRLNLFDRLSRDRGPLHAILRRLMREGSVRRTDATMLAMAFVGPLIAWRHLQAIGADIAMLRDSRKFARQHVDQFLRGAAPLSARPSPPPAARRVVSRVEPSRRRDVHGGCKSPRNSQGAAFVSRLFLFCAVAAATLSAACNRVDADGETVAPEAPVLAITAAAAVERQVAGVISVSGTLAAQDDADIAAEVSGRVLATPAERGTRVDMGSPLVQIVAVEAEAQVTEAQANVAQIEARLGLVNGATFDVERVPEVSNARAAWDLARAEFERAQTLQRRQLLSQAEFDQRAAQTTAAERQYDVARNGAAQQYQALMAARARAALAQKALADTVVRAPFAGVVGERFVSTGDYVTRGTRVASVLRVDPLRVLLTVTEQDAAAVSVGRPVVFSVDAHPGESFTGQVRYVSPSVTPDTRALMVEAVVPNPDGRLRPGFFATARIERRDRLPRLVVPAGAVRMVSGTARVFVIDGDRVKERVITTGQTHDDEIEVASGLEPGERVATSDVAQLTDGARVAAR